MSFLSSVHVNLMRYDVAVTCVELERGVYLVSHKMTGQLLVYPLHAIDTYHIARHQSSINYTVVCYSNYLP